MCKIMRLLKYVLTPVLVMAAIGCTKKEVETLAVKSTDFNLSGFQIKKENQSDDITTSREEKSDRYSIYKDSNNEITAGMNTFFTIPKAEI
jgi:hypothetical protein